MVALRTPTYVPVAVAAFLGVVMGAAPGHATCDPTTDPDKSDIANTRMYVAAFCDCAGARSHGAYVRCAVQHANLLLYNKSCAGAVKRCAAYSTCGKPAGAVTCCVTGTTGTRCGVKRDAARCTAPAGTTACVGSHASCCDACGSTGCMTTTTTLCANGTPDGTPCGPLTCDPCSSYSCNRYDCLEYTSCYQLLCVGGSCITAVADGVPCETCSPPCIPQ
jgi:hypothetical protein